jgi:hypothetical protein
MTTQDTSCMYAASALSCGAMSDLAQRESENNMYVLDRMINDPTCPFNQHLADRGMEHALQKTTGASKKLCVTRLPTYQEGPWIDAFPGNPIHEVRWEQWTRAKMPRQPGQGDASGNCLC